MSRIELLKQIADALSKMADSSLRRTRIYEDMQKERHYPFWYFWKWDHLGAYVVMFVALTGYWLNWRADIINSKINQIEASRNDKLKIQRELTRAAVIAKEEVLNQIVLCGKEKHTNPSELKSRRNHALIDITSLDIGLENVFGQEVQNEVDTYIKNIDTITDVCKLQENSFDEMMRKQYRKVTFLTNKLIQEETKEMEKLSRHERNLEFHIGTH